jgi:enamine deaminase RidA (YjgF/YER057c/UK114 family)
MTITPTTALADLGYALPPVPTPLAAYVPATRVGRLVFTSGQLPVRDAALVSTGRLDSGDEEALDRATAAARVAALNALAVLAHEAGSLDAIHRVVKITVFVASAPEFTAQPAVADGASRLLRDVFGERGAHARSAVGVAALPLDATIEIELIAETTK